MCYPSSPVLNSLIYLPLQVRQVVRQPEINQYQGLIETCHNGRDRVSINEKLLIRVCRHFRGHIEAVPSH